MRYPSISETLNQLKRINLISRLILEFEVELAADGIIFYSGSPKMISGIYGSFSQQADVVADWLKARFGNVEIDGTPPP